MAKGFNLTAQLNIQGPNNLKPVISKLKTALDSVNGNINIKISGTSTKTINGLTTALQSLSKASIQTNANLLTLSQTIGSLGSGLASLGGASSGVAGLSKVTSSVSSTKKAVVEATSALADFGKQSGLALKRFAAFTAVSTAAFSLGAAIKSGFQEFVVFDKEIVRLAQVTGKSTKELGGITKEITRLSTGLGVASADLLQVTTTLAQAGLTAGETRIALEALAKSALAPSFDSLKETTEGSIAAMRQFGIQAGELEAALGSVNAVAAAFAVESSDIITAIQRTGGVFASSSKGVSQGTDALNEFIAVFTSIRATTRESAETIATGLRTIFTRIQRGDTIEALKEYGIVLTDLKGKFVGPYEATRRLSEGLKSLDPRDLKFSKIVEELGGFRQIGKVIPLIKEFASAEAALEVAYKGQSSLAKDAAIAQQSLAVQFTKTRESFVALIRDIGDSASFKVFITLGLGLANAFITLAGALKPLLPMLLTLATIKIGSSIGEYSRSFMSGFAGKPKGKSGGGVIGFARGGFVPGTGSGDTIPAMLEPGEFVIRKKAVDTLGASNLHSMNKSGGGSIQKFAAGGKLIVDHASKTPGVRKEKSLISKHIANGVNALTQWYGGKGEANASTIQEMGQYNSVVGSIVEASIKQLDTRKVAGNNAAFDLPGGFNSEGGAGSLFNQIGDSSFPIDIKKSNSAKYLKDSMMKKITNWYNGKKGTGQEDKLYAAGNLKIGAAIYSPGADETIPFGLYNTKAPAKKWQGGMIQKFAGGTTGTGVKAQQGATAAEMYAAIKSSKLRVPNESRFGQFAGKELTDEIIRKVKRPPDASMSETKREAYRNTGDFVKGAYDKDQAVIAAKLAERIQKSTKVALVGLLPFGHSKNTGPIDINGRDIMIYERGLDKQYEQAVLNMQAGSAGVANQFATDIQKAATIGGLKEYDFDDTLVTGAGVFDADGKIDVPGYKNIKRVEEALSRKTVALTPLGVDLKQQLESDPTALANIRIRTARPQSNAPALSKTLARLGLNIPATLITGLDGANKAVGLNPKATLVDDHAGNIEDVRKAGKKGIQYAPISALSQNTSMATGQANIEGAFIEQAMAMFGAPIIADAKATRAIDYPSGLGPAGSYFGLPPDWPAEVKRTIDSKSRATAIDEFTRYLFPKQVPVGKNLGGSIQKFAMGGASSDTVPAMLTPGEFVINKKAARSIGYGKLNKMNHADSVQGFANGGPVGGVQYFKGGKRVADAVIENWADPKRKAQVKEVMSNPENDKKIEDFANTLYDAGATFNQISGKLKAFVEQLAKEEKASAKITKAQDKSFESTGVTRGRQLEKSGKSLGVVELSVATSLITSKLQELSATFAKSNSNIAFGMVGLVSALEAGSSAMLAISVAKEVAIQSNPKLAEALEDPNSKASRVLSIGTATTAGVSALGAGASAIANKLLDAELAKNTKSLSEFDKSLQDLKDATDADAKSEARKRVQESFLALSKQIDSSKDTIAGSKTVKALADGAVGLASGAISFASTIAILMPLMDPLKLAFPALGTALGTLTAGISGVVAFLGTITLGPFILGVAAVAAVLGVVGYALGLFETNVNIVTPELTALAKAASAAAAANNALSLTSKSYISQQLAAASIIKATAKKDKKTPEEMRATFNQVSLPKALKNIPGLEGVYKNFDINPVNVALTETIIEQIHRINPKIDTVDKSLAEVMSQVTDDVGKKTVETAKKAYIDREYSNIVDRDPSKNINEVSKSRFGLVGAREPSKDPRERALQQRLEAATSGEGDRTRLGMYTTQGQEKAKQFIVENDAANQNFAKLNADLLKSQIKAVEMGITSLANTLKLFSSSITKTTEDLASSISLVNEQTAMYFGEGKIEAQKYNKEITALSNPSAATQDEIKGAYIVVRKNFSSDTKSQELVNKMQSNTLAQSTAEQQLPAIVEAINKTYETPQLRNDAMDNVANMLSKQVATASGLGEDDPQIVAYKASLGTSLRTTSDTAITPEKLGEITKDYEKSIQAFANVTEEAKKALESLAKANQLIADQQNTIVSKSLKNMELGFTQFSIGNQFAIDKMRLFGESVSLDTLNAPIDNQLKTLTGGGSINPVDISKAFIAKSAAAQDPKIQGLPEQTALKLEADKLRQALDLLATSTDAAQNAMGKAAERQESLNTKRNLLESMLTGGAAKRNEMREFNNALVRLNEGDRSRLQTDIPLILKNIPQLGNQEQTAIRGEISKISGFEKVANLFDTSKDAIIQQSLATAGEAIATRTSALALTMEMNKTGIDKLTTSLNELKASVDLAFPKSISDIQAKTASTTADINKRSPLQRMEDRRKNFPILSKEEDEKRRKAKAPTEDQKERFSNLRAMLVEQAKSLRAEGYHIINSRDIDPYLTRTDSPKTVGEMEKRVSDMQYNQPEPFLGMFPLSQPQTKPLPDSVFSRVTAELEKPIAALTQAIQGRTTTETRVGGPNGVVTQTNGQDVPLTANEFRSANAIDEVSRQNGNIVPHRQTPTPPTPQPTIPTQTAPLTDTTSNTKFFAPMVTALGTLAGAMKTLQETMAPTTTDTTSPTPNSPLNGVGIFKDSVASFVSAIQALEQVKIETVAKVNVINEVFVSGTTTLSQASIDKIEEAYAMNTNEMIAKNNKGFTAFGNV